MFALHPQLQADCVPLGRFQLCQLLLLNDATYPWFILVPERDDIREIYQLSLEDQRLLIRESSQLAQQLASQFKADKINIAALGNVVPQLHLHHIVRYRHDPAWPAPIWGKVPPQPYGAAAVAALKQTLIDILGSGFKSFA